MSEILAGAPGVFNLIDDIPVHGATKVEHDKHLRQTLETLAQVGVILNKPKCRFGVTEISFLGCLVSKGGIKPNTDKVIAIKKLETPRNVVDVCSFFSMANHLARFLPNLSGTSAPLRQLLQKGKECT